MYALFVSALIGGAALFSLTVIVTMLDAYAPAIRRARSAARPVLTLPVGRRRPERVTRRGVQPMQGLPSSARAAA
jgi:hypothetical protein